MVSMVTLEWQGGWVRYLLKAHIFSYNPLTQAMPLIQPANNDQGFEKKEVKSCSIWDYSNNKITKHETK